MQSNIELIKLHLYIEKRNSLTARGVAIDHNKRIKNQYIKSYVYDDV